MKKLILGIAIGLALALSGKVIAGCFKCFSCDGTGMKWSQCYSCNGQGGSYSTCFSCSGRGENCY